MFLWGFFSVILFWGVFLSVFFCNLGKKTCVIFHLAGMCFQRNRGMFVTHCARVAAGARDPANVRPARHSSEALSVSSTVTSIRGKTVVTFVQL